MSRADQTIMYIGQDLKLKMLLNEESVKSIRHKGSQNLGTPPITIHINIFYFATHRN